MKTKPIKLDSTPYKSPRKEDQVYAVLKTEVIKEKEQDKGKRLISMWTTLEEAIQHIKELRQVYKYHKHFRFKVLAVTMNKKQFTDWPVVYPVVKKSKSQRKAEKNLSGEHYSNFIEDYNPESPRPGD